MNIRILKARDTNLCKEILSLGVFYAPYIPKIMKPKYKFSRARWYSAELPGQASWRLSDEYNDIIKWCTERFDSHPAKPDAWSRWWVSLGTINFRDEKDYHWFILRWGA